MPEVQRWYATGKRKTAVARVYLTPGKGTITVNERTLEDYFPRAIARLNLMAPLTTIEKADQFDARVKVRGGGPTAQADAVRHGLARALTYADPAHRPPLKKAGFLTRDAREKERKKYGQPGARKRFQYSKR